MASEEIPGSYPAGGGSAGSASGRPPNPRVLFLVQRYPPAFGGGGLFFHRIRGETAGLGFISIVLTGNRGIAGGRESGVHRLPSPGGEAFPRLDSYLFALMAVPALLALRRRYDIIHTVGNAWYVYLAILTGRLLRKPVLVSSIQNRADDPGGILPQRFGTLKNRVFSMASAFVCCSGLQIEAYRAAGYPDAKVHFVPIGIELDRFAPCGDPAERAFLRDRLGLPREGFVAITLGAIVERKGIDLLVEAWIRFRRSGRRGTLVLVGPDRSGDPGGGVDPRFVESVREELARAGESGSVVFTGKVANPHEYLRCADAFALMSRGEGFPAAILEAMATGLPLLLWNLPDYAGYDLKDGVHGFLVPPFNTGLLEARLAELADSTGRRRALGEAARALVSCFPLARSVASHLALYRSVAAGPEAGTPAAAIPER